MTDFARQDLEAALDIAAAIEAAFSVLEADFSEQLEAVFCLQTAMEAAFFQVVMEADFCADLEVALERQFEADFLAELWPHFEAALEAAFFQVDSLT